MSDQTEETIDRALKERLRRPAAGESYLEPDPVSAVRARMRQRRNHRRRTAAVATAAAILIAAGIIAIVDQDSDDESLDVVSPPTVEDAGPSTTEPTTASSTTGPETTLPTNPGGPPLGLRSDVAMTWTGSEIVVWGGDVEAFNMGVSGTDRSFADGAAYDPATGAWRAMSPSPLPATADTPIATMTDLGVVIVRGTTTALWDPASDTWRLLDDAPTPAPPEGGGAAQVSDLTADGGRVISYSANALLDLDAGAWSALPDPPATLARPTTAWTGEELIVIGGPGNPFTSAVAIAYDPGDGSWRTLPEPPADLHAEALSAAWDGSRVVVVNYDMTAVAYDPVSDSWSRLPAVPARFSEWSPQTFAGGGLTATLLAQTIAVLGEDDRWEPFPYGVLPLGRTISLDGSTRVATWATDTATETNTLTVLDLASFTTMPRRQVGAGSIEVEPGDEVTDATYDDIDGLVQTVKLTVATKSGGGCSVASTYLGAVGPAIDQPVREELPRQDGSTTWYHDEQGTTWETEATESDLFSIICDDPADARRLATTARFS